jgi:hypothetical protein
MSDNYTVSKTGRQTVLSTAVRFDHSDVPAGITAGSGCFVNVPANHIILRCKVITVAVGTGGTSQTVNVGTAADEDGYGANLAVSAVAGVDGAGALLGELQTAAAEIHVTDGTGTAATAGADYILALEYVVLDRANETYG